ncbi:hypothetical protein EDD68_1287 [Melghiribacillus thermohalophilus]|uniref:Uncharacterized protein n=1 Tax=Melghiribacillus thermohalophilus TaxID=1324956 RepID=A0A4R3MQ03_9BACI|nr:hypothetical protein [Melghiribacillus thermohalophilus]TCT17559.1 hypothetical protein EDD68_1287 [Melghiribacillus thermohalophilus]
MNILANQNGVGSSKFELWLFKFLYFLTFKKSQRLEKIIHQIERDLKAVKNKQV